MSVETIPTKEDQSAWSIFLIFLTLGLTSFGGPIAHLGYFREEFVVRKQWLCERRYADLVALCQFLPGPASSQVGMALGLYRLGYRGALAAWAGFTLPSAFALILFAIGITQYGDTFPAGVLSGLKLAAIAVVVQAIWGMARSLCFDATRVTLMAATCCAVLAFPSAWGQVGSIVVAGLVGRFLFKTDLKMDSTAEHQASPIRISHRAGIIWLSIFSVLLIGLPLLTSLYTSQTLAIFDAFYRAGSLVFGGGHVVLPLLQAEVVPSGWVQHDVFITGYAAAQAVPGPLFTFAAFLGASMETAPSGWFGGLIALIAIFTPSFLLVVSILPFWESMRRNAHTQAALSGVNAAVVGLLLAALYDPLWTNSVHTSADFALALIAFVALMFWKLPSWCVVLASGLLGWLILPL